MADIPVLSITLRPSGQTFPTVLRPQFRHFSPGALALALMVAVTAPMPHSKGIGMHHHVPESAYLDLAANTARYPVGPFPDFRPVAAIGTESRPGRFEVTGSGTLVAPDWILTAAHVVMSERRGQDFRNDLEVRFGTSASSPTFRAKIIRVATPIPAAELRPLLGHGSRFSEAEIVRAEFHDLALLQLAQPVPDLVPAVPDDSSETMSERLVYIAGFGDAGFGDNPRSRSWTDADLKRAAQNILDREITRNPHAPNEPGGIVLFDFDSGTEERNSLNRPTRSWERLFGTGSSSPIPTQLEGASYPGDSGGPAFAQLSGAWKLVAVSGYGTGYPADRKRSSIQYGDILVYTRVSPHAAWIKSTTTPPVVVSRSEPVEIVSEAVPTPNVPVGGTAPTMPPPIFRPDPASPPESVTLTEPR